MQNNWKALVRPETIDKEDISDFYGKFIAKPLERGFGITLGNALRRVLLSSLQGSAVVGVRIEGVQHEFTTIPEVSEDVTEIILNLKSLGVWLDGDSEQILTIDAVGPCILRGRDIQSIGSARILTPDQVICTISEGGRFRAELYVRTGHGYFTSEQVKDLGLPAGVIPMDAIFSPVKKVSFSVSDARVGQRADYNQLEVEIATNGGVNPEDALAYAAKIIKEQVSAFINFQEVEEEIFAQDSKQVDARLTEEMYKSVDELELSVRAANCLEHAGLRYIGELVLRTEAEMLKTKNFGRKTLNEIKDLLSERGLHLGMKIEGFDLSKLKDRV